MASSSVAAVGNLAVSVLETRDISLNFVTARIEFTCKFSEVKKNSSSHHQFTDNLNFRVANTNSDLEIEAWKKQILFKDKLEGVIKLPLKDFLDEKSHSGWFKFVKPKKGANPGDPLSPPEGRARSASVSEGKEKKTGEVRLEIKFTATAPVKEVLPGIVFKGEWTETTAGGSLINNHTWVKNPQYLLTVLHSCPIDLKLRLPEEAKHRSSFYVLKYDEFYNGRQKVVFDTSEIIKVDNFFCPISSQSVNTTLDLTEGEYIVIPFSEETGIEGTYTLSASTKQMDDIDFYELPKTEKHKWTEFEIAGEWVAENSGGGDILGLEWRKNPQYLLTITKTADVSVVLQQEESSVSIGFYIVKQIDNGKKVVDYEEEVAKTDSFKSACTTGVNIPKLEAGNYVIITSTFEAGNVGKYQLLVYSNDPDSNVALIKDEWKHKTELKGEWKEETAGGSPNNNTFTNNPQFNLIIPQVDHPVNVLIQLIQESSHFEETGIGFFVLKRTNDPNTRLKEGEVKSDDVRVKPEGWMQKIDAVCRATIQPDEARNFTIIPSTFKPGVNRSFHINVFSEDAISCELIV